MRKVVLAPGADADVAEILDWSLEMFGEDALARYEMLISQALDDLADDPERAGVLRVSQVSPTARIYHLRHSRGRVSDPRQRVGKPRHFVAYRIVNDSTVEVCRFLHDSMDIEDHYPDDWR